MAWSCARRLHRQCMRPKRSAPTASALDAMSECSVIRFARKGEMSCGSIAASLERSSQVRGKRLTENCGSQYHSLNSKKSSKIESKLLSCQRAFDRATLRVGEHTG